MNEQAFEQAVDELREYETWFRVTTDSKRAMLVCPDGTMYSGTNEYGDRVVDHRQILESYMMHSGREHIDRYSGDLWTESLKDGFMVVMPEVPALILPFNPTKQQENIARDLYTNYDYLFEDANGNEVEYEFEEMER